MDLIPAKYGNFDLKPLNIFQSPCFCYYGTIKDVIINFKSPKYSVLIVLYNA